MIDAAQKSDLIDIPVTIKHVTERAVLVHDGAAEVWLPLSQVEITPADESGIATMTLPEWLATAKGLI